MLTDERISSLLAAVAAKQISGSKSKDDEPRGVKTVKCSACSKVGRKIFIRFDSEGKARYREDVWCPGTWNHAHVWDKHWQFIPNDSDERGGTGLIFPDGGPHKEYRKDGKR